MTPRLLSLWALNEFDLKVMAANPDYAPALRNAAYLEIERRRFRQLLEEWS